MLLGGEDWHGLPVVGSCSDEPIPGLLTNHSTSSLSDLVYKCYVIVSNCQPISNLFNSSFCRLCVAGVSWSNKRFTDEAPDLILGQCTGEYWLMDLTWLPTYQFGQGGGRHVQFGCHISEKSAL